MSDITDAGRRAIIDLSQRYSLSEGAVEAMARAVANGGGSMAQFNIPELGGSGQWMMGGMTMVGDMFNHGLQAKVSNLCGELSAAMSREMFFLAPVAAGGAAWWPSELGSPASVGGQNQLRYAYFPAARRVAVDPGDGAPIVLLDAGEHQIGGFSQQQSGVGDPLGGISFSSQFGQFALTSLRRLDAAEEEGASDPAPEPTHAAPAPSDPSSPMQPANVDDILATIAKLASLRDAGALTEDEFSQKKTELLARL